MNDPLLYLTIFSLRDQYAYKLQYIAFTETAVVGKINERRSKHIFEGVHNLSQIKLQFFTFQKFMK